MSCFGFLYSSFINVSTMAMRMEEKYGRTNSNVRDLIILLNVVRNNYMVSGNLRL